MIKKPWVVAVAVLALAATGCKESPKETPTASVPQAAASAQNSAVPAPPPPPLSQPSTAGGHKGKVVATMDGGAYTFMELEEKGQKFWVGVKQTKIHVGDEVEFPESPFLEKFTSKALKRTFDNIFFVTKLRVNGKKR